MQDDMPFCLTHSACFNHRVDERKKFFLFFNPCPQDFWYNNRRLRAWLLKSWSRKVAPRFIYKICLCPRVYFVDK